MHHQFHQRIYVGHTDMGGIVYYANYFMFAECARAEFLRSLGVTLPVLHKSHDGVCVVRSCDATFQKPAYLDDILCVETKLLSLKGAQFTLSQTFFRKTPRELLVDMNVTLAWLQASRKPGRIPAVLKEKLLARHEAD